MRLNQFDLFCGAGFCEDSAESEGVIGTFSQVMLNHIQKRYVLLSLFDGRECQR